MMIFLLTDNKALMRLHWRRTLQQYQLYSSLQH